MAQLLVRCCRLQWLVGWLKAERRKSDQLLFLRLRGHVLLQLEGVLELRVVDPTLLMQLMQLRWHQFVKSLERWRGHCLVWSNDSIQTCSCSLVRPS